MLNRKKALSDLEINDSKKTINKENQIEIKEFSFVKKINLRLDIEDKKLISSCNQILGVILPIKTNSYVVNENNEKIIWLGPNEWLIVNFNGNNFKTFNKLQSEIGDCNGSVTDVSENRTIIRLYGNRLNKLLSKFLFLNLDKNLSDYSSCAQTLFAKVPILLTRNINNYTTEIDIYTNTSHAKYIYDLIVDGAKNLDF